MGFCTHQNVRGFDTDHQLIISHILDDLYFIQSTLHQTFCRHSVVLFHQFFFQRTAVYTDTDRNLAFFRHINHSLDAFPTSDISRINTYLVRTVFHRCDCQFIIKMNVCYQRNMNLLFDLSQCSCSLHRRHSTADDLTSRFFQCQNLRNRRRYIFCFGIRHRLNQHRMSATDHLISDFNCFCMFPIHRCTFLFLFSSAQIILFMHLI